MTDLPNLLAAALMLGCFFASALVAAGTDTWLQHGSRHGAIRAAKWTFGLTAEAALIVRILVSLLRLHR